MAMEVEIKVNIVMPEKKGNIPIFDYNKEGGWSEYQINSNKIAKDIISLIDKYKDVNERQRERQREQTDRQTDR